MVEPMSTGMRTLEHEHVEREVSRFKFLNAIELGVGSALLVMILVTVLWQAASRYYPSINWAGAGELARYGLVAMTFILAGHLFGSGGHITITIFDTRLNPVGQALLKIVGALLVLAVAFALVWSAAMLLSDPFTHSRTTSVIRIPITYVVLMPLIGFSLMILRVVETLVTQFKIITGVR
jgi:TRAP-type C4-dicarboxylate transport system permease small subunit